MERYGKCNSIANSNFLFRFGRGQFSEALKISRSVTSDQPILWQFMRLIAFDCPDPAIQSAPYEDRYHVVFKNYRCFFDAC